MTVSLVGNACGPRQNTPGGGFAASMKNEKEGGGKDGASDLSKQPGGACDLE